MSIHLSKILRPENIVLDLEVSSKKRVFEQAGLLFENHCGISRALVTDNLFARESMGSTGLGYGVAVPHGRIEGLKGPLGAFIRLASPVPFEAPDGKPVNLLFFLLIPQNVTQQHLEILSEIAAMFSDSQCRRVLTDENDSERIYRIITGWEPGQPLPS